MRQGDLAPDFSLTDQNGQTQQLSTLLTNGPVVLFFYPAAMTTGCTKEACSFRDNASAFADFHAQRVGISMDDVAKQAEFSSQHNFDYPLLADTDGAVAKSYGVKRAIGLLKVKRTTFVINQDRTIRAVISSEFNMNAHVDQALAALAN
ncbi:MAG: redoxin domain-containing protein [Actinobacteria bacterium]|uniref:thioredoxin-dependent peroxiredoxin n=1 Tax=freshwater metagenome TaxID=449393 RepID=A0A6J6WKP4_9ZZZZ|nr:redoxin domain-containing protein [Actinomycetota bacterium]